MQNEAKFLLFSTSETSKDYRKGKKKDGPCLNSEFLSICILMQATSGLRIR